jgi:hypothetical protein
MTRLSKFDGATLTLTITEDLTIDSRDYGGLQTVEIPDITDVIRRIVTVTTTEATIATFSGVVGAGNYIVGDVMYMRFSNLDDTNHLVLTFANGNDDEFAIKLDRGHSFMIVGDAAGGMVGMIDASGSALSLDLDNIKSITADADGASVDLEMYIACK